MFIAKCLLTLLLAFFCQNFHATDKCQFGVLADNTTQTLVVTVSAEPGAGQDLIRDLIKSSQNATLRATDSSGTPLRALDDANKGPAPLGLKRRPKLEPSPTADPPEPGKRCPRDKPPATGPPQKETAEVAAEPTNQVAVADKVDKVEACNAQCSDQDGVEETVNICDEDCEAASEAKTEGKALKEFGAVVDGGTETAADAAKDGEEIKKAEEACRPCKKSNPCGGIEKVDADVADEGICPVADVKPAEDTCPAADGEVEPGTKICSAEGKKIDPCGITESKKGADPCRPADAKPPADPAVDPATGETANVEVKVVEEPQCRISLEEETQVNADCRSCSARVLPSGGVKLSCFQCEHRPSDQTCYFARKVGVDFYGYPYLDGDRGFCPAITKYSNVTCDLGDLFLNQCG